MKRQSQIQDLKNLVNLVIESRKTAALRPLVIWEKLRDVIRCGWIVKDIERMAARSFLVKYVGEMITNEEAEKHVKKNDAKGRTYLFDLDFKNP